MPWKSVGWFETKVCARRPSNLEALKGLPKEKWADDAQETWVKLAENYKKLLQAVIQQKATLLL